MAANTRIVGVNSNGLRRSDDGATWVSETGVTTALCHLTAGASPATYGRWILARNGQFLYSDDGLDTTSASTSATWQKNSRAYSPQLDKIVCVGATVSGVNGGFSTSSDDGLTWPAVAMVTNGVSNSGVLADIAWGGPTGNRRFLACGTGVSLYSTTDGSTWTKPVTGDAAANYHSIAWSEVLQLWILSGSVTGTQIIRTSPDGETWTLRTPPGSTLDDGKICVRDVAGSPLILIAGSGGAMMTSPDGTNWTTRTSGTTNVIGAVSYSRPLNKFFFASRDADLIRSSPDAITWSDAYTTANAYSYNDLASWVPPSWSTGTATSAVPRLSQLAKQNSKTVTFTAGTETTFVVPRGVTQVEFFLKGAAGGDYSATWTGGNGGSLNGSLTVTPGETLTVRAGGVGSTSPGAGYNGGGTGGGTNARGGGGATDIRQGGTALANRVAVAGGGGGGANGAVIGSAGGLGGHGGGTVGEVGDASNYEGGGGTQSAGGTAPGVSATAGTLGVGGNGGGTGGGGGGGGYYGGGGGGNDTIADNSGGGGGGSGYYDPVKVTSAVFGTGVNNAAGSATFIYANQHQSIAQTLPSLSQAATGTKTGTLRESTGTGTVTASLTLPTGYNSPHATIIVGDYLYVGMRLSPARLAKINVNDFNDATYFTFPSDGFHNYAEQLCYAETTGYLYTVHHHLSQITISRIDPTDLSVVDLVTDATRGSYVSNSESITTDGQYLYVAAATNPSTVLKYDILTGDFVDEVTIDSTAYAHAIRYAPDDQKLYVTGGAASIDHGWLAVVDAATLTVDQVGIGGSTWSTPTDEIALTKDFIYVLTEDLTPGTMDTYPRRFSRADIFTNANKITFTFPGTMGPGYAAVEDSLGYVWLLYGTSPGQIIRIKDRDIGEIVKYVTTGHNVINEFVQVPSRRGEYIYTTFTSPGQIHRWRPSGLNFSTSTLPALGQTASGSTVTVTNVTGTATSMLPTLGQAASGKVWDKGTSNQTLPSLTQAAAGTWIDPVDTGTSAQALPKLTQSGVGRVHDIATSNQTLPSLTQAASGTWTDPIDTGTSAQTLPALTQTGAGRVHDTATSNQTLPMLSQAASGMATAPPGRTGTASQTLHTLSQAATGTASPPGRVVSDWSTSASATTATSTSGTALQTLTGLSQAGAGRVHDTGSAAQTLPTLTQASAGTFTGPLSAGTAAQTLAPLTQAATGRVHDTGSAAQSLPALTQSASGTWQDPVDTGTSSQTLPSLTQAATGTRLNPRVATAAQTLAPLSQSAAGTWTDPVDTGTSTQTLQPLSQAAVGNVHDTGTAAQTLPTLTQSGLGRVHDTATSNQTLPKLTQAAAGTHLVVQYLVPDGDVALNGWTDQAGGTVNIFTAIDEVVPDDSDYIKFLVTA